MQRRGRDGTRRRERPRHRGRRRRATGGRGPIPPRRRRQLERPPPLGRCGDPDPDQDRAVGHLFAAAGSLCGGDGELRPFACHAIMPIAYKKPLVCAPITSTAARCRRAARRTVSTPASRQHRPAVELVDRQSGTMAPPRPPRRAGVPSGSGRSSPRRCSSHDCDGTPTSAVRTAEMIPSTSPCLERQH